MEDPQVNQRYCSRKNGNLVIVKSITESGCKVVPIINGVESGEPYEISFKDWKKQKYEEVSLSQPKEHDSKSSNSEREKPNEEEHGNFEFIYDKDANEFQVYKDGRFVSKIECHTTAGKDGKNAYEEWAEKQPEGEDSSWSAFLKMFHGEPGKDAVEWSINEKGYWCRNGVETPYQAVGNPGNDGKSTFEVWKEKNPSGSWEDYLETITGKNGSNGDSAFEIWKKLDPTRVSKTEADFFRWIVEQVENKIDSKEGATWIPQVNVDGEVTFTNDRDISRGPIGPYKIKGKDGETFRPVIREDDTLIFVDQNGAPVTQAITCRGKSAFEVWKDMSGNAGKTEKDFFEFLKGEKGDDGTDGIVREAKHSYLDIKDHTCPVQTIDTDLIVNLDYMKGAMTSDTIIEERLKEIEGKRAEGNEVYDGKKATKSCFFKGGRIFKNWAGWFKEFSWWCAGADRPLLRMCPSDHSKYTGIGTVILFTALMAWFSSFIAMDLVFEPVKWGEKSEIAMKDSRVNVNDVIHENDSVATSPKDSLNDVAKLETDEPVEHSFPLYAIIFATFWALMIFFLDRFITNTMYSDGKVSISKEEFLGGLPRILIAIFLGVVISAPLELHIFDSAITEHLNLDAYKDNDSLANTAEDRNYTKKSIELQNIDSKIRSVNNELLVHYETLKLLEKTKPTLQYHPKVMHENNEVLSEAYTEYKNTSARTYEADTASYNKNKKGIESSIENCRKVLEEQYLLREAINKKYESDLTEQKNEIKIVKESRDYALLARLKALHELAMDGYEPLFSDESESQNLDQSKVSKPTEASSDSLSVTSNEPVQQIKDSNSIKIDWSDDTIAKIVCSIVSITLFILILGGGLNRERNNLLKVVLALIFGITIGCGYEVFHRLYYFFTSPIGLIMLLFILIDISPVLYKMMLADGIYDNYIHQEKLLKQDKIRLSLARMVRHIDKGELKTLAPFIMGDIYQKMKKYSITDDGLYNGVKKDYKSSITWENDDELQNRINEENKKVFEKVLEYKKRIILASYQAWYRDMRDALIGSPDDPEGAKIDPKNTFHENPGFENQQNKEDKPRRED